MIKSEWIGLFADCPDNVANKIIVELSRLKINVRDISVNGGVALTVKRGDIPALSSIEIAYNIKFASNKLYGFSRLRNGLKVKAGIILGLILGIVLIVILSNYTLGIKISCDQEIFYGKIEQTLQKSGLKCGIPLSKVDSEQLENDVLTNLEESVFVTVHISGVVVYVDVVTVPMTQENPNNNKDVLSQYQGVVTRVIVNSGTALVKVGDSVKSGQTLIGGYINTNKDDYQTPEQATKVPVVASGEVYAKVFYHKRIYAAEQTVLTRRTGRQIMQRQLYIGKYPIGKIAKPPYDMYESVTSYSQINVLAPINVATITYYETENYTLDSSAYKETSIIAARAEIMDKLPPGAQVINEQIIDANLEKTVIDFYIEVEQRIDDGGHNYSYVR